MTVPGWPCSPTCQPRPNKACRFVASSWFAVYGPNGMAAETQVRISAAIQQVVASEAFRKRAEEQGAKALFLNAADLARLDAADRAMWGRTIKVANIKAD